MHIKIDNNCLIIFDTLHLRKNVPNVIMMTYFISLCGPAINYNVDPDC
jgi:hypothetical protein